MGFFDFLFPRSRWGESVHQEHIRTKNRKAKHRKSGAMTAKEARDHAYKENNPSEFKRRKDAAKRGGRRRNLTQAELRQRRAAARSPRRAS